MEERRQLLAEAELRRQYGHKYTTIEAASDAGEFASLVQSYGMKNAKRIMRAKRRDLKAKYERMR